MNFFSNNLKIIKLQEKIINLQQEIVKKDKIIKDLKKNQLKDSYTKPGVYVKDKNFNSDKYNLYRFDK